MKKKGLILIALIALFIQLPVISTQGTDRILMLDFTIEKSESKRQVITIDKIYLNEGYLKQDISNMRSYKSNDLRISLLDKQGQLVKRTTIPNPLDQPIEYVSDDFGKLEWETISRKKATFFIRTRYHSNLDSVSIDIVLPKDETEDEGEAFCFKSLGHLPINLSRVEPKHHSSFDVVKILDNGPTSTHINFVILGDGYTFSQQNDFMADARWVSDYVFNTAPYNLKKRSFNVFAVKVISNVTGAAMNPNWLIDNYFGSTFGYYGIDRLLVPTKASTVKRVLNASVPGWDQPIMVVNSTKYGGSGGWVATNSVNSSAREIAVHEIAHSFVGLIDEYWPGIQYAREGINMTRNTNPNTVRWSQHIGLEGVGIYPHSESPSWHRPHQNCKMRYLGFPFCRVCRYATIARIESMVRPQYQADEFTYGVNP